jgi:alpha-1,6-mannosyltransferase
MGTVPATEASDPVPDTTGAADDRRDRAAAGGRRRRAVAVGFAGAVLLALAGYGAGARPHHSPIGVLPSWARLTGDPAYGLALLAWLAGTALLVAGWWLLGRTRPPLRVVLVATALWALPLLLAPPLESRDIYAYAAQGDLYAHGFNPYRVGPAAWPSPWLREMSPAWLTAVVPYGPLALLVMRLAAWASAGHLLVALALLRLAALAGLLLVAAYLPRLARACGVPPGTATWLGLASPLLLVHLVSGAHNDALMLGLLITALAYAAGPGWTNPGATSSAGADGVRRTGPEVTSSVGGVGAPVGWGALARRGLPAGVALALAAAVKATALVVVPFAVVLVLPAVAGRWRFWRAAGVVVCSVVVAFGVVTAVSGLGFGWVGALAGTADSVQWTSVPTGVGMAVGAVLDALDLPGAAGARTVCTAVALYVVLPVALVALWWPVRHGGTPASGGGAAGGGGDVARVVRRAGWGLGALVVCSPAVHPWYVLWAGGVLAAAVVSERVRRGVAAVVAALAFLVLPDGYNLARVTVLLGAPLDVALVVVLAVVGVRYYRRRWARRPA